MTTTSRERTDTGLFTTPSSILLLPVAGTTSSANPDFPELQSSSPESSQAHAQGSDDYIHEFFRYRPATLRKHKDHTPSTSTREPAFFDRHLDPELQLKHVVYLPSITTDLMAIADDALKTAHSNGTLPPLSDDFPTQSFRKSGTPTDLVDNIVNEQQIEGIYKKTTAKFCSRVAATLEFQLPSWGPGHLRYTLASNKTQGIADGFLNIKKSIPNKNTPPLSKAYTLVADTFSTLAIWEFKSLTAGTLDVMEAIVRQAVGDMAFPWEGCELGKACVGDTKHTGKDGLPKITGNRMGLDAKPPTCPSIADTAPKMPGALPVSLSKHARKSAAYITQQTWTEAVQDDVTFVIIHAGNLEIIGIRNRKNQTLFLSDVIKVNGCDYGRLHTGLYIAILRDAANRTLRLKPPKIPSSWTKFYGKEVTTKMAAANILEQACLRDWLIMQPSSKKTTLIGFNLNTYHFRGNPSKKLEDNTPTDLRSFFRITLNKQLGHFIAKGTLAVDGNRLPSKATIVKVAHTDDAIAKLRGEHEVYLGLLEAGVTELPRVIGFFQYVDIEGLEENPLRYAVLVMQDVGLPVCQIPEDLTREHLTQFQDLLRKIHRAGFVHTKLSRNNLMINVSNPASVSIVSFGDARRIGEGQTNAFNDEYRHMLNLLPNPLKHTVDGEFTDTFKDAFPTAGTSGIREDSGTLHLPSSEGSPRKKRVVPPTPSPSRRPRRTR